jgi:hypothetical protein
MLIPSIFYEDQPTTGPSPQTYRKLAITTNRQSFKFAWISVSTQFSYKNFLKHSIESGLISCLLIIYLIPTKPAGFNPCLNRFVFSGEAPLNHGLQAVSGINSFHTLQHIFQCLSMPTPFIIVSSMYSVPLNSNK